MTSLAQQHSFDYVRVICDETDGNLSDGTTIRRQALFSRGDDYFIYSYVNNDMAHETMLFRGNENGEIVDYAELYVHSGYCETNRFLRNYERAQG